MKPLAIIHPPLTKKKQPSANVGFIPPTEWMKREISFHLKPAFIYLIFAQNQQEQPQRGIRRPSISIQENIF